MKKIPTYNDIFNQSINIMKQKLETYGESYKAWNEVKKAYKDPDGYPIDEDFYRYENSKHIKCTADGLISIKRIYKHEGFNPQFIETYTRFRKTPIIFFPSEFWGINMSRFKILSDKIDHTLFDLKNYLSHEQDKIKNCKLLNAYNKPITKQWLEQIETFENLVDSLGIKGIFTNDNYEVFDLEANDGSIIKEYSKKYDPNWSDNYYRNLKNKIIEFEQLHNK